MLLIDHKYPKERFQIILAHAPPPQTVKEAFQRATRGWSVILIEQVLESLEDEDPFDYWSALAVQREKHIQGCLQAVIKTKSLHAAKLQKAWRYSHYLHKIRGFCTSEEEYQDICKDVFDLQVPIEVLQEELRIRERIYTLWFLTRGNCTLIPCQDELGHYLPEDLATAISQFL